MLKEQDICCYCLYSLLALAQFLDFSRYFENNWFNNEALSQVLEYREKK